MRPVGYYVDPDDPDHVPRLARGKNTPAVACLPEHVDPDIERVYALDDAERDMLRALDCRLAEPAGIIDTVEAAARALVDDAVDIIKHHPDIAVPDDDLEDECEVAVEAAREAVGQAQVGNREQPSAMAWLYDATLTQMAWRLDVLLDEYDDDQLDEAYATGEVDSQWTIRGVMGKMYCDAVHTLLVRRTALYVADEMPVDGDGDTDADADENSSDTNDAAAETEPQ